MYDWRKDRRLLGAIGLAVIILGIKWLFTGSLLFDIDVMRGVATRQVVREDGNTAAVPVERVEGVASVATDFVITALVAVGTWAVNLGEAIYLFVSRGVSRIAHMNDSPPTTATDLPAPVTYGSVAASLSVADPEVSRRQDEVLNFARSAASNDKARMEELRIAIRKPRAVEELLEAVAQGDFEIGDVVYSELKELWSGAKEAKGSKARTGAKS